VQNAINTFKAPNQDGAFSISLLCPSSFFEALDEMQVELASWINMFSFTLEILSGGIEFGLAS
jgi:hypothetical protein